MRVPRRYCGLQYILVATACFVLNVQSYNSTCVGMQGLYVIVYLG